MVLTGGTKGIGLAIIEKFLANQFDVVTCSRNQDDLQKLKENMASRFPSSKTHVFRADLGEKAEVIRFAEFVKSIDQPIDVLVNNTGIFIPGKIMEEAEDALEKMINTNLYSAYHLTRALLKPMIEMKRGDVFNMCSVASIKAYPNGGAYAISKFALLGFSKGLREETKEDGIRVVAVLPGATLTASWEGVDIPEERFMKASDVADAIWGSHCLSRQTVVEEIVIRPQLGDI